MEDIIIKLFQSRDVIHLTHLKEDDYSKHVILDEYYKKIVEEIDRLVELTQGSEEILLVLRIPQSMPVEDPLNYLENLVANVQTSYKFFNKSCQHSILDDISELLYSTIYKMKFLKQRL